MVLVVLHYFSLVTTILFGNAILIIFSSITNFELVTQKYTKILVILGEIREITQNPREIKRRFNLKQIGNLMKPTNFWSKLNPLPPWSTFPNFA